MKRITLYSFLFLTLIIGAFGFAHTAEAELTEAEKTTIADRAGITVFAVEDNLAAEPDVYERFYRDTYLPNDTEQEARAETDRAIADTAAATANNSSNNASPDKPTDGCGYIKSLGNPLQCMFAKLMNIIMWLSARLLWIAGILLNATLDYTLNFSGLLSNLPVVDIGWKIIRDIANIVFIFIALWSGISITLGIQAEKAWGLLAHMVLVALFINFSLFITQTIVDASNIGALHFYRLIDTGGGKTWENGLSSAFMNGLKLQTLYNPAVAGGDGGAGLTTISGVSNVGGGNENFSWSHLVLVGLFGSLFMVIAGWVFFAASIMFIYRAVTLMLLMILSPLAFVGWILPGAGSLVSAWWSKLWSQAFFAPIYMALAYVVVATINSPAYAAFMQRAITDGGANFAAAVTSNSTSSVAIIFNFIILICLMVGCLVVAQNMGAKGSEMAMSGFEKIKGVALGIAGATVRGAIKAPSAALRGAGDVVSGRTTSGVGNWMATTKLLHNKYWSAGWAKKGGEGLMNRGKSMQESRLHQVLDKAARKAGNIVDVRHLEERAGQSALGNTFLGKAVRSVTTGALANAPIGDKSLQEAYEETQHDKSVRNTVGWIAKARAAHGVLKPLLDQQNEKQDKKLNAEKSKRQAEEELEKAKIGTTPEEQQKIAAAKENVTRAEIALGQARATPGVSEQVRQQLQQNVMAAREDLKKATPQELIRTREDELTKAAEALATAAKSLEEFNTEKGTEIVEFTKKKQEAYSQISSKEFLDYAPKEDLMRMMDFEHIPLSHYTAVMNDEHRLTEGEKEVATHNFLHRLIEISKRGETRNEWFNENIVKYQKFLNKQSALIKNIAPELSDEIKKLKKELEEKIKRASEEKKKKKGGE